MSKRTGLDIESNEIDNVLNNIIKTNKLSSVSSTSGIDDVIKDLKSNKHGESALGLKQEDLDKEFDVYKIKKLYRTTTKARSYLVIAENYEEAKQITEDFLNKDDGNFEYNRIVINIELLAENTEIPRGNSVNDNSIKTLLPLGL